MSNLTQAANKLKSEMELFGTPPKFPEEDPEIRAKMEADLAAAAKAKADKAAAKAERLVSVFVTFLCTKYKYMSVFSNITYEHL